MKIKYLPKNYPFGMPMPDREYQVGNKYRYGFNGKENDNEIKGDGNQQDYGARIHDTRLARFLSIDPLTKDYPFYSAYQFAGNDPTNAIDRDGLEPAYPKNDGNYTTQRDGALQRPLTDVQGIQYFNLEIPNTNDFGISNFLTEATICLTPIGPLYQMVTGKNPLTGEKASVIEGAVNLGLITTRGGKGSSGSKLSNPKAAEIIFETKNNIGKGDITSKARLTESDALDAGIDFVGKDAKELGKPGSGIFESRTPNSDGSLNRFKMDDSSITGKHPYDGKGTKATHVGFEITNPGSKKPSVNNHVPIDPD